MIDMYLHSVVRCVELVNLDDGGGRCVGCDTANVSPE